MATAKMSVVIVAYSDSVSLRLALQRLQLQTVASELECVLVTTCDKIAADLGSVLQGLASIQTLVMTPIESAGRAKAAGVFAATAALVAFLEDHSFPERAWAESLIKAHHRSPFAVVAPVIRNANPATCASWGCFLVYYGQYMVARPQPELKHLPANHSCYRRSLLLEYGQRLPDLLEAEFVLHQDLLARGFKLSQESAARAYHLNHSWLRPSLEEYWFSSRVFAAVRAAKWKPAKRILYFFGAPLLPLVRSLRIVKDMLKGGLKLQILAKGLPAMFAILCSGSAGEMIGYAAGSGKAKIRLKDFESRRASMISDHDLREARLL